MHYISYQLHASTIQTHTYIIHTCNVHTRHRYILRVWESWLFRSWEKNSNAFTIFLRPYLNNYSKVEENIKKSFCYKFYTWKLTNQYLSSILERYRIFFKSLNTVFLNSLHMSIPRNVFELHLTLNRFLPCWLTDLKLFSP